MFSPQMWNTARDATMYSILFYILSHPQMYKLTAKILPRVITDRALLHAVVFMMVYMLIHKVTNRV